MRVAIRRWFHEKDCRRPGEKRYRKIHHFKLDKPFPLYLLDSNKYNISRPYYASFFKYITIEFWDPGYNVAFYDEKERYATHKILGFAKEGKAIEYFNEVLLDISQLKGGEHNGRDG